MPKPTAKPKLDAANHDKNGAIKLLKEDHRNVTTLFESYKTTSTAEDKQRLARQICRELVVHTILEEELFYPECRQHSIDNALMDEAQVEHDMAKVLIHELVNNAATEEFYDSKVKVLSEYIRHHIGEEEKPETGIFARAEKSGIDLDLLGTRLQTRKQELMGMSNEDFFRLPQFPSLQIQPTQFLNQEHPMAQQHYRDDHRGRDEYGRFTGGYSDDRSYRAQDRERDEYGRFVSDDDRRSSRSGGRSERDDDRYSHGGWFGDSRGHSEASRRGWEERQYGGGSRGGRYDEDDDRRSYGGGRGWYGDPQGHSEASRHGWDERRYESRGRYEDDDDRRGSRQSQGQGHGGWFGDSEGHSEAARRGWDERGGHMRSRGRSEYDDDDNDRGGEGRGWYGDPRGHSEAARRGWRNR